MNGYQYLLASIPLDDLSSLNEYGLEGWHVVAVVGRGPDDFQVLLEKPLDGREHSKPGPRPKRAA